MSNMNGKYEGIIRKAVISAATSGAIPFSDVVIMSGIWGTMIVAIASRAGHPLTMERAFKLAGATLAGIGTFKLGTKAFTMALHFFPGIGTITAMGIDSFINAFQTYRLGVQLSEQFDRTTVSMEDMTSIVKHVMDLHPGRLWEDAWAVLGCITGN
jgi:uncharacterized protein (DUF697 family)